MQVFFIFYFYFDIFLIILYNISVLFWRNKLEDEIKMHESKMKKSIHAMNEEFLGLRAGRATPVIFEKVMVDYYGTATKLNQVAQISVPENNLIIINPHDKSLISEIEKAIQKANLSLNPANDGKILRIKIPPLTKERRVELVKQAKQIGEKGKVAIRNIRKNFVEKAKKQKKDKVISEDDEKKVLEKIQKITNQNIKEIDVLIAEKEKEIMQE